MQGIENLSDIAKLDLRYTLVVGLQILAGNGAYRCVKDGLLSILILMVSP